MNIIKTGHENGVSVLGEAELDYGAGVALNHARVVALAVHITQGNVLLEPSSIAQVSFKVELIGVNLTAMSDKSFQHCS